MKKAILILVMALGMAFHPKCNGQAIKGMEISKIQGLKTADTSVLAPAQCGLSANCAETMPESTAIAETGGMGSTGGTLPGGGGKKGPNDFAQPNETGGRGQSIDPGKRPDNLATSETGGVKVPPDGKKLDFKPKLQLLSLEDTHC